LDTSACLSFHKSQETNLATFFLSQDNFSDTANSENVSIYIILKGF
jgi:hypothetical protein